MSLDPKSPAVRLYGAIDEVRPEQVLKNLANPDHCWPLAEDLERLAACHREILADQVKPLLNVARTLYTMFANRVVTAGEREALNIAQYVLEEWEKTNGNLG